MKYKVMVNNRFGEGWQSGDVIEMDNASARVPLEKGEIICIEENNEEPITELQTTTESNVEIIQFNNNLFTSKKDLMLFFNLFDTNTILCENKLEFWIENGTLLGYYRDGKFIDNDTDIDIGLFKITDDIVDKFKEKGFEVYNIYGDKKTGLEYTFKRNGYKLDLFLFKKKSNGYYQYVWGNHKYSYKFPKFKLERANFYGMEFNIPDNIEEHLTAQYGDWKEKRPEWNYINDPKNANQEDE